jgi:serine/threonine-protein kinase PpkA
MMHSEEELSPEELRDLLKSYMPDIPGYRVLRRIGKGGMSQVYLGVQTSLDRQVAIKVMSPEALTDEKTKQRFEQEARTIAKLEHPCIVGIHEVGRTPQGLLYYVLPYLARGHLGQRDFTQDEVRTKDVLRSLLSALEYAHARGIVHRDVKAENVLFDNADRPLLTDFGIALSRVDSTRITATGFAVGSGGYMAPEQARGEAVDGRADLYSVGVLAYELLTGQLPYQNNDPLGLALMHAQDPIPRLPPHKKHWQSFIDRSMAKAADNRFRNAQQMLAALNQIPNGPETTGQNHALPLEKAAPSKLKWLLPASAVAFALFALGWMGYNYLNREQSASDFFAITPNQPAANNTPPTPPVTPLVQQPAANTATPAKPAATDPANATATPDTTEIVPAPVPQTQAAVTGEIQSNFSLGALPYDSKNPAGKPLYLAKRQLAAERYTQPKGNNAAESLLGIYQVSPNNAEANAMSDQLIESLGQRNLALVKQSKDKDALAAHERIEQFVQSAKRQNASAWKTYQQGLYAPIRSRLEAQGKRFDLAAVDRTKKLALQLELDPTVLEPIWTQASIVPKKGEQIQQDGEQWVLAISPSAQRSGLAFMREEVTVADYQKFAAATGRGASRCRNRTAPITIKTRRWNDPGFSQAANHPVVCVSYADAEAYARWLSQKNGETYRLPTFGEWSQIARYSGTGDACRDGHISCGARGTASIDTAPSSPLGIKGVKGNAREWTSDCGAGCAKRKIAGLGWRDNANRSEADRLSDFDADTGYDDAGFRLVREVGN